MVAAPADRRLCEPTAKRNRDAILAVLARVLPAEGLILEIASGTGEHVVHFASSLSGLRWQPSDPDVAMVESIAAWSTHVGVDNIEPPLTIDTTAERWEIASADAVVCINMIHIAPWTASEGLMAGAARIMPTEGVLYLYGPFQVAGAHTAPSNAAFDAMLRQHNPAWGVRDLNDLSAVAKRHGFVLAEVIDMPTNNKSVVYRRV